LDIARFVSLSAVIGEIFDAKHGELPSSDEEKVELIVDCLLEKIQMIELRFNEEIDGLRVELHQRDEKVRVR
jgi:hypothetical protein